MGMERVTLRIPKKQIERVERMVENGEYPNRSEAIRASVRQMLKREERAAGNTPPFPAQRPDKKNPR